MNFRHGVFRGPTFAAGLAICLLGSFGSKASAGIILPDPIPGVTSLQFGDFDVYSLALLNYIGGYGTTIQPGEPYYVASAPGQLSPANGDLVVATGPAGNKDNEGIPANPALPGVDNAWETQNAASGSVRWSTFAEKNNGGGDSTESNDAPDPGGSGQFVGDVDGTWDASAGIVTDHTSIMGPDTIFYFNLNENGKKNELAGQDLLVWVKMTLGVHEFILDGSGLNPVGPVNGDGVPGGGAVDPDRRVDWAYVHSEITVGVNKITGIRSFIHQGPPDGRPSEAFFDDIKALDQNLGANNAAFAAYNPELNTLLNDNPNLVLSIDMELANINNGYEQLFIQGGEIGGDVQVIPEPASLAIWSIFGTVGLIGYRRKRKP